MPYTSGVKYRFPGRRAKGIEMSKYIIGPMPAQEFLDTFFPKNELHNLGDIPDFDPKSKCFDGTVNTRYEPSSYDVFVSALFNKCLRTRSQVCFKIKESEKFAPGLKFVNSSASSDSNPHKDPGCSIKPDVCVYRAADYNIIGTDSSLVEIIIEFKWQSRSNPFTMHKNQNDNAANYPRNSNATHDTLGQISEYAAAHFSSQFRTHIYSILLGKRTATILRWDRAGAIATESIDYNNSPHLVEFFRRYSCASPAMRGMDQSVSEPTPTEAVEARRALDLDATVRLFKLEIPRAGSTSNFFITQAPKATAYTPPGRATRVFTVYDITNNKKVLLKDSWRINLPDIHAEGLTYKKLMDAKVRNIPRCVASGDIKTDKYHSTKTNKYYTAEWARNISVHLIPHRHYRLVLDVIGRPLTKFTSSYEMVTAVRDALIGEFQFM
jgi:hypothetical protein